MRFTSIVASALLSIAASSVNAAPLEVRQTTDCNPSYDVAPSTPCFTNCNVVAGQTWVPGWTMDHTSPLFLSSLALMCNKTGPNYRAFMTAAGTCMAGCSGDDPTLFAQEFAGACAWWAIHKDDTCSA